MTSAMAIADAEAAEGEVWEHRQNGQTVEVHVVLSYQAGAVGRRYYRLLNLISGDVHPDVLIGLSGEPDYGWRRVA